MTLQVALDSHSQVVPRRMSLEEEQLQKKILVICQGNLPFIHEALSEIHPRHIYVVTCDDSDCNIRFAVVKYVKRYFDTGEVEEVCYTLMRQYSFDSVIAPSETDILRAAKLRELFSIEGQNYRSAVCFRDKIKMKKVLREKGISVPPFVKVSSALQVLEFARSHGFPLIIKPNRGYGSLKTRMLNDIEEVHQLLKETIFDEFHEVQLDLEVFIKGEMYHIDGIVRDGLLTVVWPSKCINTCLDMTTGKPTGGYLLSPDNPIVGRLNKFASDVLNGLPTPKDCGFHLEVFDNGDELVFCEIGSRIGGPWINDLWKKGMGIDLKAEFMRAQAKLPSRGIPKGAKPSKLIGSVIFPPKKGKVVTVPQGCPISNVIEYVPYTTAGAILDNPEGMLGHIASAIFCCDREDQLNKTARSIEEWFAAQLKLEPIS